MKIQVKEDSFLLEYLVVNSDKPRKVLKTYLKYGNVKVNNKVVTKFDRPLKVGDSIEIGESKNKNRDLKILYEDKNIIVIEKESGMLSIATESEGSKTAYKLVMDYLKSINKNNKVFVVHRLDKDTSGVLLFAKNSNMKNLLQKDWEKIVTRKYVGIVEGKIEKISDTIKSLLNENDEHYVYSDKTGKKAITQYNRTKYNDKYSMLDIIIYTGRKNQIRVHMKDIGHPIIGDSKYGNSKSPIKRLGLHANCLEIFIEGKKYKFESEVPKSFYSIFRRL